ncbi:homoaconitase/3-isopropylmalate dehydratase large subunit [Variovorax sp. OAS795]
MTMCHMAIEAGARVGLIGVDETTLAYLKGRPYAPHVAQWEEAAVADWRTLRSDAGAVFDATVTIDATCLRPMVTWGTSPGMVVPIDGQVPGPAQEPDAVRRAGIQAALGYMGLRPGTPMVDIAINKVFIGSCTNARIEDLRAAGAVVRGRRVAASAAGAGGAGFRPCAGAGRGRGPGPPVR